MQTLKRSAENKTGSPGSESLLVCADTVNLKYDYFVLINQQQPTTPIQGETEVGRHLTLASNVVVEKFV